TVAMIEKYFGGVVPAPTGYEEPDRALIATFEALPAIVEEQMNKLQFSVALSEIWKLIGECNKYIDITQPWVLGKTDEGKERLKTVMYVLCEGVRAVAVHISPVMTRTPLRIYEQLGVKDDALKTWESVQKFGALVPGTIVKKGDALFPRVDVKKEIEAMEAEKAALKPASQPETPKADTITIDVFAKVKLIAVKVEACEKVEGSDKLLKFTLNDGSGTRTVLSGIAKWYKPEDTVGKTLILVSNLAPRKMKGIMSEGMLLSAEDDKGNLKLLTVDGDTAPGSRVG
ncbi:MAG: methionine--tRNA ligase subunit beta, partial [Clostridia bacterium]|nr:methionine--tRNA ligase subunit beta [Clostridia bacterium]